MKELKEEVGTFLHGDSGQDMVEYGLIVGLIGLGGIASMSGVATKVGVVFNAVGSTLTSAT